MPYVDINGARCPMGCGSTLHLSTSSGLITCLAPGCPDQGAAHKLLSEAESEHVVIFGPDSFTVRHPLRDRLADLLSCQVHDACNRLGGAPGGRAGAYRVTISAAGELELEKLDDTILPL